MLRHDPERSKLNLFKDQKYPEVQCNFLSRLRACLKDCSSFYKFSGFHEDCWWIYGLSSLGQVDSVNPSVTLKMEA